MLPSFRPDQSMRIADPIRFKEYVGKLGKSVNISIGGFLQFMDVLKNRHDFFSYDGMSGVSDHGLEQFYKVEWTESELKNIFDKVISGKIPERLEIQKFQSALLLQFAEWDFEKNWVQQYHIGALRNNNSRTLGLLGPDTDGIPSAIFRRQQHCLRF
ncbi:MAG: glucuronate isomerase [Puia sp.]